MVKVSYQQKLPRIVEALKCKLSGERKIFAFILCRCGHFDLGAYDAYLQGKLQGFEYPEAKLRKAQAGLPKIK
jgi:tryptophan synthase beta chain